ncbi:MULTISPECIES: hypothetical protein [unclassified Bradyrhizobium]|jgi:hypothetical protein|uniref:hypothetical protein n=1 Tax=unclassified Bradyrhizobium TaxID=2631580 RepID=UPI00070DE599|nr:MULTISPECIES: hypothetical protein [unclassified Bradyrhizobium]KQT20748.1 hypothetical protein ASG57_27170 [Bradyrhizobium sp. Leaf396]
MPKLTILSAATILLMMAATPVFAQSSQFAQQEPGAFAAMYPNAGIRHAVVRAPAHSLAALAYLPPGKSHAKGHVTRR